MTPSLLVKCSRRRWMPVKRECTRNPRCRASRSSERQQPRQTCSRSPRVRTPPVTLPHDGKRLRHARGRNERTASQNQTRKSSGYRRLQARHRDLIGTHERLQEDYAHLKRDHEQLEKSFSELLALHDGLLADLRARKSQPVTSLLGRAHA
jgi:hypothetical protein